MNRSTLRMAIIVLTLATAGIHFYLVPGAGLMFILNGLGYLALMVAYLKLFPLPVVDGLLAGREKWVLYAYLGFTGVTILGWVVFGMRVPIGYADKVIELLLLAALWLHSRAV